MEEEAYYEAKREAARVAKMQRQKEQMSKQSGALVIRNGPKAWLGDDESDWDVCVEYIEFIKLGNDWLRNVVIKATVLI